jgi:hypothetical protein
MLKKKPGDHENLGWGLLLFNCTGYPLRAVQDLFVYHGK